MGSLGDLTDAAARWNSSTNPTPLWLDGKQVTSSAGTFAVNSPNESKELYHSAACSEKDVKAAIDGAAKAFPAWSKTKPNQRRDILLKAADIFEARWPEWKAIVQQETGATEMTTGIDYELGRQTMRNMAGLIQTISGQVPIAAEEGRSAMILREPYGVVLAIAPWNMPYVLGWRAILSPLAAGNTVILKGSEFCPGVFWALSYILHEAGLPAGCLQTVYAKPEDAVKITTALIEHPAVQKVNFTGSTNVGRAIAQTCAKNLKPCVMELGGKAPNIVCEDADITNAATGTALGAFFHSGQICMSAERAIVHKSVMGPFLEALKATVPAIFGTDGLTLVTSPAVKKNQALMQDAVSKGATAVLGAPNDSQSSEAASTRMQPIIVSGVTKDMDIYYTESFGPTLSVLEYETEDQALALANDTEYGLAASVYTEDLRRGLRFAKGIVTGAVHINNMTIHDESTLPHGGAKGSGWGRFNAREGLEEWVRTKNVTWRD